MKPADVIVVAIVVAIAIGIIVYLVKAKKRGEKCVGCPYAKQCQSKTKCSCSQPKDNNK